MSLRVIRIKALLFLVLATVSGCEIINPDEETPSYIRINRIDFDPQATGYASAAITDAWVFASDPNRNSFELIGVYELPATVPLLISG
ncbi:MAG: hypothetical protein LPJ89_02375, partial [Hymenobacteraceae bacterium]|nr:hypothetical protein [Hymenobacteraceae bacterium]MDX5394913.1 hypothetical protein [Hymenobacteraceae bacterium]MDX5442611.1 hypothetical protein [Hymenobacteraceae bacterium]MDX5510948.1 hypothetical protein [Hymenobacteraceae bacterium]